MLSRRVLLRGCSVFGLFERGQTPSAALLLQGPPDDLPRITAHQKPFEGDGGGEEEVSSSRPSTPRRLRLKGDGQPGGARLSSCPPAVALALHTPAPGAPLMGGKTVTLSGGPPLWQKAVSHPWTICLQGILRRQSSVVSVCESS